MSNAIIAVAICSGGSGGWRADLLEDLFRLLGQELAVPAPEGRGELAELLVPSRQRQALEPEPEEPSAVLLLVGRLQPLDPPAQPLPRRSRLSLSLHRDRGVLPVDAVLEKLDEQLLLALEVGVEGAAREAGLRGDLLDARALEATAQKDLLRGIQQTGTRLGLLLLTGQAPVLPQDLARSGHVRTPADSGEASLQRRRTRPRRR